MNWYEKSRVGLIRIEVVEGYSIRVRSSIGKSMQNYANVCKTAHI